MRAKLSVGGGAITIKTVRFGVVQMSEIRRRAFGGEAFDTGPQIHLGGGGSSSTVAALGV